MSLAKTVKASPQSLSSSYIGSFRTPSRHPSAQKEFNESGQKIGNDKEVNDIKVILDNKFNSEIELWRSRLQDASGRNIFLESDNTRLVNEILYWKSQCATGDVEQLPNKATIRVEGNSILRVEVESLRNLLIAKIQECHEIKANVTKLEILNGQQKNKLEATVDYETRIYSLKKNYNECLDEVAELRRRKNELESKSIEVQKVKQEAGDLKALLEAKQVENSRIRRQKSEVEIDNLKSKQNEIVLLQKESALKNKIASLENQSVMFEDLRRSSYLEKQLKNVAVEEEMRKSLFQKSIMIEKEISLQQQVVDQNINRTEDLRRSFNDLQDELIKANDDQVIAESQSRYWRDKSLEAERIKQEDIVNTSRLNQVHISSTERECNVQRSQLVHHLDTLAKANIYKSQDLNKVENETNLTDAEKRILQEQRLKLQMQIDDLNRKQEISERHFQAQMQRRQNIHSSSVERLRRDHENEMRRMNNQITALNNVIDSKREEADQARSEANAHCLRYVQEENKARKIEDEQQYWRNQTYRVINQKDIEYSAEKQLEQSQLRALERVQQIERQHKLKQSDYIVQEINQKESEVNDLYHKQQRNSTDLALQSHLKHQIQAEAELNRSRTFENQRSKVNDIIVRDSVFNTTADSLRQSGHIQSNALRNEVQHLNDTLIRKDIEARNWRDSYLRLSSSPQRKY